MSTASFKRGDGRPRGLRTRTGPGVRARFRSGTATGSSVCAERFVQLKTCRQLLPERSAPNVRASAVYCRLAAGLSGGAAGAAWFSLPSPFLTAFAGGSALVPAAAGFWHGRGEGEKKYFALQISQRHPG